MKYSNIIFWFWMIIYAVSNSITILLMFLNLVPEDISLFLFYLVFILSGFCLAFIPRKEED